MSATLLDPAVREYAVDIARHFGSAAAEFDPDFPDEARPGTLARVMTEAMPRLSLPEPARPLVPEVVARFLEYLRESGRLAEGDDWAAQVRILARSYAERLKPGGGVKGGQAYGATDDFGYFAVENKVHVNDLHATMLHLLGVDHTKLTYKFQGRDFRLTDVAGHVVKPLLA